MSLATQRTIAAKAGVDRSTVSLALRDDPRIPSSTRKRIQAVARELGYRRNPLLSVVLSHVRHQDGSYRGNIGFLWAGIPRANSAGHIRRNFLAGARRRAHLLGYKIDEFALFPDGRNAAQLARTLRARNIRGLIVDQFYPGLPGRRLPLDLSEFAAAGIGIPLVDPPMHYVANDQYLRPIVAARRLFGLGYRRFGLLIGDRFDIFMDHRCKAGYLALQHCIPELEAIPILTFDETPGASRAVRQWLRRHRPDAVLSSRVEALSQIREAGVRVPEDVGFVHLDWLPTYAPAAGVYGNSEQTGASAADMVISQLLRGEQGPPEFPINYFVPSSWVDGKTVRRVGASLDLSDRFFGR